jgi:hypothetical protein
MKPTKKLALEMANLLELSALAPHEDLKRGDVREIIGSLHEGQFDPFQLDLLTDWTYAIADARLGWRRRRRPASELLVL